MRIVFATLVLALAACSPAAEKKAEDAAAPAVAAPENPGARMRPGEWSTTVTFVDMQAPGMPAGMAKKIALDPVAVSECVTTTELDDFVNRRAIDDRAAGTNCTSNEMKVGGGRIEGSAACTDPEGNARTLTMSGTYGDTSVDLTMKMEGQTPRGPMSSTMRMQSQWTGECKS
jgi:hypothetical protein